MKTIVLNLATEYRDEGEGPAILLLHGWGDTLRTFDALAAELGKTRRVIRLDLPGFGGSEITQQAWNVSAYANFVRAFLEKLGIAPKTIIGHSFGGRIAIKGVAQKILTPEQLILIAAAGNANRKTLRSAGFAALAKTGKVVSLVLPHAMQEKLRARLYAKAGSDYLDAGLMRETFLNVVREDLTHDAEKIAIPTLIIWGADDATTPLYDGRRFHKNIPGSRLEVIEGAGHFVHREKAAEVARLIETFI